MNDDLLRELLRLKLQERADQLHQKAGKITLVPFLFWLALIIGITWGYRESFDFPWFIDWIVGVVVLFGSAWIFYKPVLDNPESNKLYEEAEKLREKARELQ